MTTIINISGAEQTPAIAALFGLSPERVETLPWNHLSDSVWPEFANSQDVHLVFFRRPERLLADALSAGASLPDATTAVIEQLQSLFQQQKTNRRGYRLFDVDMVFSHPAAAAKAIGNIASELKVDSQVAPIASNDNEALLAVVALQVEQHDELRSFCELLNASMINFTEANTTAELLGIALSTLIDNERHQRSELANLFLQREALREEKQQQEQLNADYEALKKDYDLQQLQLEQIQEELESYFIKAKESQQKVVMLEGENKAVLDELFKAQQDLEKLYLKAKESAEEKRAVEKERRKLERWKENASERIVKYKNQIATKNEKLHKLSQKRQAEKTVYEKEIRRLQKKLKDLLAVQVATQSTAVSEVEATAAPAIETEEAIEVATPSDATQDVAVAPESLSAPQPAAAAEVTAQQPPTSFARRVKRKVGRLLGVGKGSRANSQDAERELLQQQINLLENSTLYDRDWYMRTYPDVAEDVVNNDANPTEHYLRYGGFEARNPSPLFDSQYYLESNPDVAGAEINPLVHYLQYGKEEGRQPVPTHSKKVGG